MIAVRTETNLSCSV